VLHLRGQVSKALHPDGLWRTCSSRLLGGSLHSSLPDRPIECAAVTQAPTGAG